MGAKCGKVTCCGHWVQRSNPGCYSLFEQSSGVGSREARLPLINGWQVRDKRLTAYTLFIYFIYSESSPLKMAFRSNGGASRSGVVHAQNIGCKLPAAANMDRLVCHVIIFRAVCRWKWP